MNQSLDKYKNKYKTFDYKNLLEEYIQSAKTGNMKEKADELVFSTTSELFVCTDDDIENDATTMVDLDQNLNKSKAGNFLAVVKAPEASDQKKMSVLEENNALFVNKDKAKSLLLEPPPQNQFCLQNSQSSKCPENNKQNVEVVDCHYIQNIYSANKNATPLSMPNGIFNIENQQLLQLLVNSAKPSNTISDLSVGSNSMTTSHCAVNNSVDDSYKGKVHLLRQILGANKSIKITKASAGGTFGQNQNFNSGLETSSQTFSTAGVNVLNAALGAVQNLQIIQNDSTQISNNAEKSFADKLQLLQQTFNDNNSNTTLNVAGNQALAGNQNADSKPLAGQSNAFQSSSTAGTQVLNVNLSTMQNLLSHVSNGNLNLNSSQTSCSAGGPTLCVDLDSLKQYIAADSNDIQNSLQTSQAVESKKIQIGNKRILTIKSATNRSNNANAALKQQTGQRLKRSNTTQYDLDNKKLKPNKVEELLASSGDVSASSTSQKSLAEKIDVLHQMLLENKSTSMLKTVTGQAMVNKQTTDSKSSIDQSLKTPNTAQSSINTNNVNLNTINSLFAGGDAGSSMSTIQNSSALSNMALNINLGSMTNGLSPLTGLNAGLNSLQTPLAPGLTHQNLMQNSLAAGFMGFNNIGLHSMQNTLAFGNTNLNAMTHPFNTGGVGLYNPYYGNNPYFLGNMQLAGAANPMMSMAQSSIFNRNYMNGTPILIIPHGDGTFLTVNNGENINLSGDGTQNARGSKKN